MEGYDVPAVEHQMNIVEDQPECYRDHGDSFDNNEDGFNLGVSKRCLLYTSKRHLRKEVVISFLPPQKQKQETE